MIGAQIGRYRVVAELGSGGMGTVYRAEGPDGPVALKVVHAHLAANDSQTRRFLREAELGRLVRQENVTTVLDAGEAEVDGRRVPWLALELIEGQTLRALLAEMDHVPEELCRHLGREMLRGLVAIHAAGIVHRDVKPENVIVTPSHEVKLMDLGLARLLVAEPDTGAGVFLGTAAYAAPEQFSSAPGLDPRTDLYSVGVVLYELACGAPPFTGDDLRALALRVAGEAPRALGERSPQITPFLEEFVHRLLAKAPAGRFPTAAEALAVLEAGEASDWWTERTSEIRVATHRPVRRIRVPRETALFGREAERARLRELWRGAAGGEAAVVLLEGEAGIGKSRLADDLLSALEHQAGGAHLLLGSWPPGGAATASGALLAAFREHVALSDADAAVADLLPEAPALVASVAALLRGDAPPPGAPELDREKLQTAFVQMTRSLAADAPVLLLTEDLHLAPREGRALFAAIAAGAAGHRVMVVGTMRPGVCDTWAAEVASLPHVERMQLARLGPRELVRLLGDALRSEPLAEDLSARIALKSDGNPYFVFEILRGLREDGLLARRPDGSWTTTRRVREIVVPDSVRELIEGRLAELAPDDLEILRVASCEGFSFDPLLVGSVVGLGPLPVLKRLGALELRHRLVRTVGRRVEFDHHQVQEVLLAGLSELHRETYHGALADTLETMEGAAETDPESLDGDLCTALAEHFLRARRGYRALRYLDPALRHLDRSCANGAAASLLALALDQPGLVNGTRRVDLLLRAAHYHDLDGRRDEHRATLDAALALADSLGDPLRRVIVRNYLGNLHYVLGLSGPAELELARESAAIARAAGLGTPEAEAHHTQGNLHHNAGRFDDAAAAWTEAMHVARAAGNEQREAAALAMVGLARMHQGRFEEGLSCFERHLSIAAAAGNRTTAAVSMGNLGYAYTELGRFEEARALYLEQCETARSLGARRLEMYSLGNLGTIEQVFGRTAAARALYERQLALGREIRDRRSCGISLVNVATLHLSLGALDRAREEFEEARGICGPLQARYPLAYAEAGLGAVAREEGDFATADRWLATALATRRGMNDRPAVATTLIEIGRLRRAEGRADEARAAFAEALAIGRELGLAGQMDMALAHLGVDDPAAAAEAEEHGARPSSNTLADRIERSHLLWRGTGRREHLVAARDQLEALVAEAPPELRQSVRRNVRLHRAVLEDAARLGGRG